MKQKIFIIIGALFIIPLIIICFLQVKSKKQLQTENTFFRVLPPHPYSKWSTIKISNNQTFVGQSSKHAYLSQIGNFSNYTKIDLESLHAKVYDLQFSQSKTFAWNAASMQIDTSGIYLYEGLTPNLFYSKPNNNILKPKPLENTPFIQGYPIDPHTFVSVNYDSIHKQNILNLHKLDSFPKVMPKPKLLTKQVDGVFCVYGKLLYDKHSKNIVYLYHYRNEYLIMDTALNLLKKGKTIDTISKAQIKVDRYIKGAQMHYTFSAPPLLVNKSAAVYNNILYINSNLKAKNENGETFSQYHVIDVYDLSDASYHYSFYLPHVDGESLIGFNVQEQTLVAQYANHLGIFHLSLPAIY